MDEFLCLTLRSAPGQSEAAFKSRLTEFWTHMIRSRPDDYERVYAEGRDFERDDVAILRRYMIAIDAAEILSAELEAFGLDFEPIDAGDTYNRAEASTSEWFQIPHD